MAVRTRALWCTDVACKLDSGCFGLTFRTLHAACAAKILIRDPSKQYLAAVLYT